ncbi:MAG: hypothetical protein ACTMHL_08390 [Janibacter sp.]
MTLFALALYLIPLVLMIITVLVGLKGLKFYWTEVIIGPDDDHEPG